MTIHQEITFKTSPDRIYEALMSSEQHGAFTGGPAEISRDAGGTFSCHDGIISGRNIELVKNERIVQAWRVKSWAEGVYSVVKFELKPNGNETQVVLSHTGVPEDQKAHIDEGWHQRYWKPLRTFLNA